MVVSGEIDVILDEKNRLTLPAQFRKEINDPVIKITRGLHKNLLLLTFDIWDKKFGDVIKANTDFYSEADIYIMQKFVVPTREVEIDKAGRILIPPRLLKYAGITKECVVAGMGEVLGIWDADTYDKFNDENDADNAAKLWFNCIYDPPRCLPCKRKTPTPQKKELGL